jgi:micrococcal nuclease
MWKGCAVIPNPKHEHPARIVRWVDADTVDLDVDLDYHIEGKLRHRLLWINAPERNTEAGKIAIAKVNELAPPGTYVLIRSFKDYGQSDSFGRWLAEIFLPAAQDSINEYLLRFGFAEAYMQDKPLTVPDVVTRDETLARWTELTYAASRMGVAVAQFDMARQAYVESDPYGRSADA